MPTVTNDKILTTGDVIYLLDRGTYNPNIAEDRVREMNIIEKDNKQYAHAKDGYFTIELDVTGKCLDDLNKPKYKRVFATREEAEAEYQKHIERNVNRILDMPKSELLKQFYRDWCGERILDVRIYKAMKKKIKTEFGVDVDEN